MSSLYIRFVPVMKQKPITITITDPATGLATWLKKQSKAKGHKGKVAPYVNEHFKEQMKRRKVKP